VEYAGYDRFQPALSPDAIYAAEQLASGVMVSMKVAQFRAVVGASTRADDYGGSHQADATSEVAASMISATEGMVAA